MKGASRFSTPDYTGKLSPSRNTNWAKDERKHENQARLPAKVSIDKSILVEKGGRRIIIQFQVIRRGVD